MPYVATGTDLEMNMLSEVSQRENIPYDITYRRNLKYGANELSVKQKWAHRRKGSRLVSPREGSGGGVGWECGISRCKLLNIEWESNVWDETMFSIL